MSDTLIGSVYGGAVVLVGAFLTWLATRGKTQADAAMSQAQLTEQRRQQDITTIIDTLQEDVASLRTEVASQRLVIKAHEETINALRLENYELRGDRAQLSTEVARLRARVQDLEGKAS